jgi:2,4-dichlorophenol 6-monooxygenase
LPVETTDVLIVGGGACGLAFASFLHDAGVNLILVERNPGTSTFPKAHYLNARTMEILRAHNIADEILREGTPLRNRTLMKWYTSFGGDGPLDRKVLYELKGRVGEDEITTSAVPSANLPQIRLEPILRKHAEDRNGETIRWSHNFMALEQDEGGVTATVRGPDGALTQIRAKYLVAADGGRTVGSQIGVSMEGLKNLADVVAIHFEADLSDDYPDDRAAVSWIRSPRGRIAGLLAMGPNEWGRHSPEWVIHIPPLPGTPDLTRDTAPETIRELLALPDLNIKIQAVSRWAIGGLLADKYRVGRVFIAGDAAHRHPPNTGLGLNTGIQDAHNLSWKLAAVLQGRAQSSLLDSYEAERRPIGRFNVDWALNTFFNHLLLEVMIPITFPGHLGGLQTPEHVIAAYTGLFEDSPMGRMRRQRLGYVYEFQQLEIGVSDVEMGFVYAEGALLADGSPAPLRNTDGHNYKPVTRPGHRLPHVWLDYQRKRISSHDFVTTDGGFALLCGPKGQAWVVAAGKVAEGLGVRLNAVTIGLGKGVDVIDAEDTWHRLRGIGDDGAILVRPDNIVGWRMAGGSQDPQQDLQRALRFCLARQTETAGAGRLRTARPT